MFGNPVLAGRGHGLTRKILSIKSKFTRLTKLACCTSSELRGPWTKSGGSILLVPERERILFEVITSDCERKASSEGSK